MPKHTWQWKIPGNGVCTADVVRYATVVDYAAEQTNTASGNGHVVATKVSKVGVHRQVWPYICPKLPGMEE